jgi:Fe-S-cluster-containing dehydrogenase component
MSKNPNVTVRMRGVMEKCTFCIQRIEEAKIARLVEAGARNKNEVPIREFKTACQQACPSDALVFGNIRDREARVSRLRESDRAFVMLKYLNTAPRVSYLARIKNPNAKMPGASTVGTANGSPHGHDEDSESHHAGEEHQKAPGEH